VARRPHSIQRSYSLRKRSLHEHGHPLEPSPAGRPWFEGAIERQCRTHNMGLVRGLPRTTFSNVLEKGEHDLKDLVERGEDDAEGTACISLTRFEEIPHVYLLDVYGQE